MEPYFQLFDMESGNLLAEFAQEHEAWEALQSLAPGDLHRLGLVRMEDNAVTLVAMEDELVRRVHDNVIAFAASEPEARKAR
jgi:hypothetical protein